MRKQEHARGGLSKEELAAVELVVEPADLCLSDDGACAVLGELGDVPELQPLVATG